MVKISILLLLLFPLLSACSLLDSRENLYLSSSHARQLKEGMEVQLNGISVGTLENIALQEDLSVLSKLRFKEELHLSVDTDFAVKSIGIFGTPALIITPGGAKELLVAGDTVNLSPSTPILLDTTLSKIITEATSNWLETGSIKDSILLELRELNRRLEELPQLPQE